MNKILGTIKREKGFDYFIDKDGNIVQEKYNWFKDKSTLVMLAIVILGGLYYMEMKQSVTNANNFDTYCDLYQNIKTDFILNNPNQEVNIKNVLKYYELNKFDLDFKYNLSHG